MKNQLLILIIALLFGCKSNEQNWTTIKISGKIENDNIKSIVFYPIESLADDYNNYQKIALEEDGSFSVDYALNKPINAMVVFGEKQLMLFLDTEKDFSFIFKEDSSFEILKENKKNNSVFLKYQTKFSPFFSSTLNYKLNSIQFAHQVDSITDEKNKFIEAHRTNISDNLLTYLENDISYYSAKEKIYYSRRFASNLIKEENNYFEFLNSLKIQNNQATNVMNYNGFVDNFINYLYLKKLWGTGVKYKNDYIEKYYIAKSELQGEALEQFITENLVLGIGMPIETDKFKEIVGEFLSENYSEKSKNILKQSLSALSESNIFEGKIAPEFDLKNSDEKIYSLSDFVKDYIILDFWASWCGPCRKEIPKMIELSEKFADKAKFIFISIDGNEANWKKANKQLGIPEPSLIIDSLSSANYGFEESESIPFYLVLDKNKKVILRNTNRKGIESLLSKWNK